VAGRILVGVDGSEASRRALRWAIDEATARGATLDAILVWPSPNAYVDGLYVPVDEKKLIGDARERLAQTVAEVAGTDPQVDIHPVVLEGDPAQVLCTWSGEAELLVVGSRGHGDFAGLLLGSVSTKCTQHARCPVVVVPPVP